MHGIEDIMVMGNVVTTTALEQALQRREHHGLSLAANLVFTGAIDDRALAVFYHQLLNIPLAHEEDLRRISRETFSLLPIAWIYKYGVLPLYRERIVLDDDSTSRRLVLAVVDPTEEEILEEIREHVGLQLNLHILTVGQMALHYMRLTGKDWEIDLESVRSLRDLTGMPTASPDPNFTHEWVLTADTVHSFSPSLSHLVDRAQDLDAELESLFDDDDPSWTDSLDDESLDEERAEEIHTEGTGEEMEPPSPSRPGQNRWFLDPVKSGEVTLTHPTSKAVIQSSLDSIVVDTALTSAVEEVVLLTEVKPEPPEPKHVLERFTEQEEEEAIEISLDFDLEFSQDPSDDLSYEEESASQDWEAGDVSSMDSFDLEISLDDLSIDLDSVHDPTPSSAATPSKATPPPIPTPHLDRQPPHQKLTASPLHSAPRTPSNPAIRTTLQGMPVIKPPSTVQSVEDDAEFFKTEREFSEPHFPIPNSSPVAARSAISSGSHAALVSLVLEAQPVPTSADPVTLDLASSETTDSAQDVGGTGAALGDSPHTEEDQTRAPESPSALMPAPALSRSSGLFKFPQRASSSNTPPSFPTPQRPTPVLKRPSHREHSSEYPIIPESGTLAVKTPNTGSVQYFAGQLNPDDSGTFRPSLQDPETPSEDSAFLQSVEDALSSAVLLARRQEEDIRQTEGLVFDLPMHVAPSIRVRWEPLLRGFEHARERDEVGFIAAGVLLGLHQRVVLLSLRSRGVAVWMVARNRMTSIERSDLSFPLSSVFCLHRCAMNQTCFLGPALDLSSLSQDPAHVQGRQAWFDLLPGPLPTTAVVFPILLLGKVVALAYCDDGPEQPTVVDREGLALIRECMEHSFERIIRERKKRRTTNPP